MVLLPRLLVEKEKRKKLWMNRLIISLLFSIYVSTLTKGKNPIVIMYLYILLCS